MHKPLYIGHLLGFIGLVLCVEAAWGATLTLPQISGRPGDTLTLPVSVDDATGIARLELRLTYDPAILTATNAERTSLTSGFDLNYAMEQEQGKITINMARSTGIVGGGGALVHITFQVSSLASRGSTSTLMLKPMALYTESGERIPVTGRNGRFTVGDLQPPRESTETRASSTEAGTSPASTAEPPLAKLRFFLGEDVALRAAEDTVWHAAVLNQPLNHGDWVHTGTACRAEILLTDGTMIRVGEETEYQLADLTEEKGTSNLLKGRIWMNIKKLGQESDLYMHAPTAVIAIRALPLAELQTKEERTIYEIAVDADQSAQVKVYQGQVEIIPTSRPLSTSSEPDSVAQRTRTFPMASTPLRERQWIIVRADGSTAKGVLSVPAKDEDDWLRWNRERDRVQGDAGR